MRTFRVQLGWKKIIGSLIAILFIAAVLVYSVRSDKLLGFLFLVLFLLLFWGIVELIYRYAQKQH